MKLMFIYIFINNVLQEIVIENCGELKEGDNWGYYDNDPPNDTYPPFPQDWEKLKFVSKSIDKSLAVLEDIKASGNHYFKSKDYSNASRKYKKASRYHQIFSKSLLNEDDIKNLNDFHAINCLNIAAVELKFKNFLGARNACDDVLKIDKKNSKALFRRGQAQIELRNYTEALNDLKRAHQLVPESKVVISEFERAKQFLIEYRKEEKNTIMKMFK